MTIIGAVLMLVIAPVIFVTGTVIGVKGAIDIITKAPQVPSGGSITLQQNDVHDLYAYVGYSTSSDGVSSDTSNTAPVPSCTVTGPDGQPVNVTKATGNTVWTRGSSIYQSAGSFTPPTTGAYKVACGDHDALVPAGDEASSAGNKAAWSIGIGLAAAAVAGIIGLILLTIGIVKLVNSGKERSQYRLAMQNQAWQQGPGMPYRG
ncbi:hypothetical protein [Calidifontibacter terrae]